MACRKKMKRQNKFYKNHEVIFVIADQVRDDKKLFHNFL